jgi:hypothetical protein
MRPNELVGALIHRAVDVALRASPLYESGVNGKEEPEPPVAESVVPSKERLEPIVTVESMPEASVRIRFDGDIAVLMLPVFETEKSVEVAVAVEEPIAKSVSDVEAIDEA